MSTLYATYVRSSENYVLGFHFWWVILVRHLAKNQNKGSPLITLITPTRFPPMQFFTALIFKWGNYVIAVSIL